MLLPTRRSVFVCADAGSFSSAIPTKKKYEDVSFSVDKNLRDPRETTKKKNPLKITLAVLLYRREKMGRSRDESRRLSSLPRTFWLTIVVTSPSVIAVCITAQRSRIALYSYFWRRVKSSSVFMSRSQKAERKE